MLLCPDVLIRLRLIPPASIYVTNALIKYSSTLASAANEKITLWPNYHLTIHPVLIVSQETQQILCANHPYHERAPNGMLENRFHCFSPSPSKREWKDTSSWFFHAVVPLHSVLSLFHFRRPLRSSAPSLSFCLYRSRIYPSSGMTIFLNEVFIASRTDGNILHRNVLYTRDRA